MTTTIPHPIAETGRPALKHFRLHYVYRTVLRARTTVRIISNRRVVDFWTSRNRRDAEPELRIWMEIVKATVWNNPADVKATFGHRMDFVQVRRTRNTVAVFDIANNKYRLIARMHYLTARPAKGRVYVLRILTHREYDQDKWKDEL